MTGLKLQTMSPFYREVEEFSSSSSPRYCFFQKACHLLCLLCLVSGLSQGFGSDFWHILIVRSGSHHSGTSLYTPHTPAVTFSLLKTLRPWTSVWMPTTWSWVDWKVHSDHVTIKLTQCNFLFSFCFWPLSSSASI